LKEVEEDRHQQAETRQRDEEPDQRLDGDIDR
jgi:hypothetical protein